jgi:hypothetical protein
MKKISNGHVQTGFVDLADIPLLHITHGCFNGWLMRYNSGWKR